MSNEFENSQSYNIDNGNLGEIKIADEVVAIIAGIAATEVEGVDSMAGDIQRNLIGKLGMKTLSKGVKITVADGSADVALNIVLKYGCSIPEVTATVQEKVKDAIESMTGLKVTGVHIHVADVKIDGE